MTGWNEENLLLSTKATLHLRIRRRPVPDTGHPALVLLHFWGGSNATWDALALGIDDRYPLVIPSLRGWGESSRGHGTNNYTTRDYANDLAALLSELKARADAPLEHGFVLIGHSLGGKIVLRHLVDLQDWESLHGIVLVAPSPAKGMDFGEDMFTMMRGAFRDFETACRTVKNAMLGRRAGGDLYHVSSLARDALRGADEAVVAFPSYGAKESFEPELRDAVSKKISQGASLRVLVIEGEERAEGADVDTGNMLRECGADVQYKSVPCGHLLPVELPEQLAALVDAFARP